MIVKLYKNEEGKDRYHEAWITDGESTVYVHWDLIVDSFTGL